MERETNRAPSVAPRSAQAEIIDLRSSLGEPIDLRKTGIHPDHWYPVARSTALKAKRPLGVSFAGDPIVLVRTAAGTVFALEDRCAHRQVPLRLGVVHGEHVQCGYHGWAYDASGRCVSVPYAGKLRCSLPGVRSYPCREAFGLVFVFPGELRRADGVPFPEVPSYADRRYKTRYLDRRVRCHYSFMHENLMDMNHQFLHRRLMGRIQTVPLGFREGPGWIEADYTFRRTRGRQPLGEKLILRRDGHRTDSRGCDLMTIRTEYPYQTLKFWTAGSTHPALDLWNVYVPVDREQHANQTFGLMMFRKPRLPGLIQVLWPFIVWFTEGIFAEDRRIVEEEQRAFERQGADRNHEIFPVILGLRHVLAESGVPLAAARERSPVARPLR